MPVLPPWRGADFPPNTEIHQVTQDLKHIPSWLPLATYAKDNISEETIAERLLQLDDIENQEFKELEEFGSQILSAMRAGLTRFGMLSSRIETVVKSFSDNGLAELTQNWQELIVTRKEIEYLRTLMQELEPLTSLRDSLMFNNGSSESIVSSLSIIVREWTRLREHKLDIPYLPGFQAWQLLVFETIRQALIVTCNSVLDYLWKSKGLSSSDTNEDQLYILDMLSMLDSPALAQSILMYLHVHAFSGPRADLLAKKSLNPIEIESELRAAIHRFNSGMMRWPLSHTKKMESIANYAMQKMDEEMLTELVRFSAAEVHAVFAQEAHQPCQIAEGKLSSFPQERIHPQNSDAVKLRFLIMLDRLEKSLERLKGVDDSVLSRVINRTKVLEAVLPFTDLWIESDKMAIDVWMTNDSWSSVAMNPVPTRGFLCTNSVVRTAEAIVALEQRVRLFAPNEQARELYTEKVIIKGLIDPILQGLKNCWNAMDDPFVNIDLSLCILNSVDFLSQELEQAGHGLSLKSAQQSVDKLKARLLNLFADHLLEGIKESELLLDSFHLGDAVYNNHFDIISSNISVESARSLASILEKHLTHLFTKLKTKKDSKRAVIIDNYDNMVCFQWNLSTANSFITNLMSTSASEDNDAEIGSRNSESGSELSKMMLSNSVILKT